MGVRNALMHALRGRTARYVCVAQPIRATRAMRLLAAAAYKIHDNEILDVTCIGGGDTGLPRLTILACRDRCVRVIDVRLAVGSKGVCRSVVSCRHRAKFFLPSTWKLPLLSLCRTFRQRTALSLRTEPDRVTLEWCACTANAVCNAVIVVSARARACCSFRLHQRARWNPYGHLAREAAAPCCA